MEVSRKKIRFWDFVGSLAEARRTSEQKKLSKATIAMSIDFGRVQGRAKTEILRRPSETQYALLGRGPGLKPIYRAECFAAPEGAAPPTEARGLPLVLAALRLGSTPSLRDSAEFSLRRSQHCRAGLNSSASLWDLIGDGELDGGGGGTKYY